MVLLLLACAPEASLTPTMRFDDDALFRSLPADVTLISGGDIRAAVDSPLGRAFVDAGALDVDAMTGHADDLGLQGWSRFVAGCGGAGCVATAPGVLDPGRLHLAATGLGMPARGEGQRTRIEPGGVPFVVDARLAERVLVAGDLPAVDAFGATRLDVGAFADLVPEGDLWIAARDPDLFLEQAADRLEAEGSDGGRDLAALLRDPDRTGARRWVAGLGLSVSTGVVSTATLRVQCVDTGGARKVAWLLDAALWREELTASDDVNALLQSVEIVRVGEVVEARVSAPAAIVAAALSGGAR